VFSPRPTNPHPTGTIETVTVMSGAATLVVAGDEHQLAERTVATFAADVRHGYVGAGSEGAQLLMTVHLPGGVERGRP